MKKVKIHSVNDLLQTKQEADRFTTEMSLFDSTINLTHLKQTMIDQGYMSKNPAALEFVMKALQTDQEIKAQNMTQLLTQFAVAQPPSFLFSQCNETDITAFILQTLQHLLGKKILKAQLSDILTKVFQEHIEMKSMETLKHSLKPFL